MSRLLRIEFLGALYRLTSRGMRTMQDLTLKFLCVIVAGVNVVRVSGIFTSQPDPTELISLYRSQEVVEAWPEQAKQTLSKLIKVLTLSNDTTVFFNNALYELGKVLVLIGSFGFLLVVAGFWTFNKFVNNRPLGWTANYAASQQCGPLQKR